MVMSKWIVLCLGLLSQTLALAQVVSVEFKEKGFLFSDAPTLNFLWPAKQPKATLVFIPGGEGRLGITPDRKNLGGFYGSTLKPLSDEKLTSGSFNVVVFDSPVNLPVGTEFPVSRQGSEHLKRIESVARYFKDKYALPVWIMGHSNGAVSVTEFYKMLQKTQKEDLIEGAIYSSARHGAEFNDKTKLPILFLAHEQDQCPKSTPARGLEVFQQQQKSNTSKTAYVLVKGGETQAQNGCHSGFHMFYGAGAEAYTAIDQFVFGSRN
jgi:hypothetical protein